LGFIVIVWVFGRFLRLQILSRNRIQTEKETFSPFPFSAEYPKGLRMFEAAEYRSKRYFLKEFSF